MPPTLRRLAAVSCCALLLALPGAGCRGEDSGQQQSVEYYRDLISKLAAAHQNRDLDAVLALCTEDVLFVNTDGRRFTGQGPVRDFHAEVWSDWEAFSFSNWRSHVEGNRATLHWEASVTISGEPLRVEACFLLTFRGGRIAVMDLFVKPRRE